MKYVTGDIVTEIIGPGFKGHRRRVRIVAHDDDTCRTESGHVYRRDTGMEYVRGNTYRAIHDPAYDLDGKRHARTMAEMEAA